LGYDSSTERLVDEEGFRAQVCYDISRYQAHATPGSGTHSRPVRPAGTQEIDWKRETIKFRSGQWYQREEEIWSSVQVFFNASKVQGTRQCCVLGILTPPR